MGDEAGLGPATGRPDDEKAERRPSLVEVMPQCDEYVRLTDRNIRLFVLERER